MNQFINFFSFVWNALKPVAAILLVSVAVATSLFAYDQYQTIQEKNLAATLIDQVGVTAGCNQIVSERQKLTLKFEIANGNNQAIELVSFGIDKSILGVGDKQFTNFISSRPSSLNARDTSIQFVEYSFPEPINIRSKGKLNVTLNLQAANKQQARASPHTIVVYEGKVFFAFKPQMQVEAACQIQVRYP